jgi:hypothetical protein
MGQRHSRLPNDRLSALESLPKDAILHIAIYLSRTGSLIILFQVSQTLRNLRFTFSCDNAYFSDEAEPDPDLEFFYSACKKPTPQHLSLFKVIRPNQPQRSERSGFCICNLIVKTYTEVPTWVDFSHVGTMAMGLPKKSSLNTIKLEMFNFVHDYRFLCLQKLVLHSLPIDQAIILELEKIPKLNELNFLWCDLSQSLELHFGVLEILHVVSDDSITHVKLSLKKLIEFILHFSRKKSGKESTYAGGVSIKEYPSASFDALESIHLNSIQVTRDKDLLIEKCALAISNSPDLKKFVCNIEPENMHMNCLISGEHEWCLQVVKICPYFQYYFVGVPVGWSGYNLVKYCREGTDITLFNPQNQFDTELLLSLDLFKYLLQMLGKQWPK